jgi:two-component system, NarL family, sensor histidine kinase DegS
MEPKTDVAPEPRANRFDGLHADAKAAIGYSANSLRAIRERYRKAYVEELGRWHALRDELNRLSRIPLDEATASSAAPPTGPRAALDPAARQETDGTDNGGTLAAAAEADAEDTGLSDLRLEEELLSADLGLHQQDLAKLELAQQTIESTWLFLERGDSSLLSAPGEVGASAPSDLRMRIVEAQEAERSRLAQEVHDGPAQALTNAIFQVEYVERLLDQDGKLARTELRFLRELLRRELGDVRSFITQLRPPMLDELGLDGAIGDAASNLTALTGVPVEMSLEAPADGLREGQQTVALRVVQEALQNVRKHAAAGKVRIATRVEDDAWRLEVRDDGRGFDVGTVAARGRRNFGLQFMRERAELIGARFEVRSRPETGTVVLLAIPIGGEES